MAVVQYELNQVTSLQGCLYRVKNTVLSAVNASTSVFVFMTETQAFSHYAKISDLETYPLTRSAALVSGALYYRQASVTRDWATVAEMNEDLTLTQARLSRLAQDLGAVIDSVVINRTTTISGGA